MQKINDPFIANAPYIDIHGFDRDYAVLKVKEFVSDSSKLGDYTIIVIHGKGKYILKKSVHEYLSKEKLVESYKIHNLNDGMTVIELKK